MENSAKKMCIVVFGGTVDKLYPAAIMSSGAVMNDMEVNIFLTFWGLMAFQKGTPQTLTAVSKDYEQMGEMMMKVMQEKNVPSWLDTLKQAKDIGNIHVYACAMTADLFGLGKDDFELVDDVIGVGDFVAMAAESDVTIYLG